MANRSIIEIDVQSDSFKRFQKEWEKYREQVSAMPGAWSKIGAATEDAAKFGAKAFEGEAVVIASMTAALSAAVTHQGELTRVARQSTSVFGTLARSTGEMLKNVTSTTFQLLKWGTLGALGIATGGALGMGALAHAGSDLRARSGRLGIRNGQLQAARAVYTSRNIDAEQIMQAIAYGQAHPGSPEYTALSVMGLARNGRSAGDNLPAVLAAATAKFKQSGGTALGYDAMGIGSLVDYDTGRYLGGLNPGELDAWQKTYQQTSSQLNQPVSNLAAAQDISGKFKNTEARVENDLLAVLVKAKDPIEKFSDELVQGADALKNFITGLGNATPASAGGTAAPGGGPLDSINARAAAILAAPHASPGGDLRAVGSAIGGIAQSAGAGMTRAVKEAIIRNAEGKYGLPKGLLHGLWGAESNFGSNTGYSTAGAFGNFQDMPGTARQYGIHFGDFNSEVQGNARYMRDLIRRHGGDLHGALFDWNGVVNNTAAGNAFTKNVSQRSGTGLDVNVTVTVPPGSDLNATATAMQHN